MLSPLFAPWPGGELATVLTTVTLLVLVEGGREGGKPRAQQFLRTPESVVVRPGDSVVLPCLLENKGGECRWEKDGLPVGLFPHKYRMIGGEGGDCSLEISDARLEWDDGLWQCQVSASNIVLSDSLISPEARLTVLTPPSSLTITEELGCLVSLASPPPAISVLLEDRLVASSQQDERLQTGGWRSVVSLAQLRTERNHGLSVTCRAEDRTSGEVLLETRGRLEVPFPPSVLTAGSDSQFYQPGDSALLSCTARGHPPPSITWRRQGEGEGVGEPLQTSEQGRLVILQVDSATAGQYFCSASNQLGEAVSAPVTVSLAQPPSVMNSLLPSRVLLSQGETLRLPCEARALPRPTFRWLQKTNSGDINVVGRQQLLLVPSVDYQHEGDYLCEATNQLGDALSNVITVNIKGRPKLLKTASNHSIQLGKSFRAEIEYCSNPAPDTIELRKDEKLILSNIDGLSISGDRSKSHNCYLAIIRFDSLKKSHSGPYQLFLANSLGNDTFLLQLQVEEQEGLAVEQFVAIGCGTALVVFLLLTLLILSSIRGRQRARKPLVTILTVNSEAETEPGEQGPPQSHHSSQELIETKPAQTSPTPADFSELLFPKSSNCGSMRRKKEEHYQDMINIYNTAIKHNLSSIYDSNYHSRSRNLYF